MSTNIAELSNDNFTEKINQGVTLVDFWAPWCGPCRMQGTIIDALSEQVGAEATIAKVDIDSQPEIAADHGVQSIPTIIVFRDGEPVKRFVGVQNQETLTAALNEAKAG